MSIELRTEVKTFAEAMERKLRQNDYKGGWKQESVSWLEKRLTEEGIELAHVIKLFRDAPEKVTASDKESLISEMADLMNFCMMIADNTGCFEIDSSEHVSAATKLILASEQRAALELAIERLRGEGWDESADMVRQLLNQSRPGWEITEERQRAIEDMIEHCRLTGNPDTSVLRAMLIEAEDGP